MSAHELARRAPAEIRRLAEPVNPFAAYAPLDRYAGGRIAQPEGPSFAATISAGWKDERGVPNVSRDGRIHLVDPDGRAPFLAECLEATDHKRLTIAFTSNDPRELVTERYVAYTASALQLYGDENGITYLDGKGGRQFFEPGSPGFTKAVEKCAVTRSVYFVLAGWDGTKPVMLFDPREGLTHHRLRFGSRNSLNNILRQLAEVARHTNGEIIGIPWELSISYRDVADPTGKRRTVPVWSLVFKPPAGIVLTARAFREIATTALEEGRQLQLPPAPSVESIELADTEYRYLADEGDPAAVLVAAPSSDQLAVMQRGAPVDPAAARRRWFAIAKGSRFGTDEGRADFLTAWTDGNFDSLSTWLKQATQQELDALLDTLQWCVDTVPPVLPRAWERLQTDESSEMAPDTADDFQAAVDAARAAQARPARQDLAPPEPEPEPVPAATMRRLRLVERYGELYEDAESAGLSAELVPINMGWTDEQLAAAGKELAALLAFDKQEQERRETAERNRETIDASRARTEVTA